MDKSKVPHFLWTTVYNVQTVQQLYTMAIYKNSNNYV